MSENTISGDIEKQEVNVRSLSKQPLFTQDTQAPGIPQNIQNPQKHTSPLLYPRDKAPALSCVTREILKSNGGTNHAPLLAAWVCRRNLTC